MQYLVSRAVIFSTIVLSLFGMAYCQSDIAHTFLETMSDRALQQLLIRECQNLTQKNRLSLLEPKTALCAYLTHHEKPVKKEHLIDAIAQIYKAGPTAQCPSILQQILGKVCEITDLFADYTGIYTALEETSQFICQEFQQVFSIYDAVNTATFVIFDFNVDFTDIFTTIQAIEDAACDKFQETWTILEGGCTPPTIITTGTTIGTPGRYCLANNITEQIIIQADRVELDLNNNEISGTTTLITVTNQCTVCIKNGILSNASDTALVLENATTVKLDTISFVGNNQGVFMQTATNIVLSDCTFLNHTATPLSIQSSAAVTLNACQFKGNSGSTIIGIDNANCIAGKKLTIENNATASDATLLECTESNQLSFKDCTFNNNTANGLFSVILCSSSSDISFLNTFIDKNINSSIDTLNTVTVTDCSNLLFNSLNIVGNSCTTGNGLALNAHNVTLKDIVISENANFTPFNFFETQVVTCDNCNVSDNTIVDNVVTYSLCTDIIIKKALFNDNTKSGSFSVILMDTCTNINLIDTEIANNRSTSSNLAGVSIERSLAIVLDKCSTSSNLAVTELLAISVSDSENIVVDRTSILANSCSSGAAKGLLFDTVQSSFIRDSNASDNIGTTSGFGFELLTTRTCSIVNCVANKNEGLTFEGFGFFFNDCSEIILKKSIAQANVAFTTGSGLNATDCIALTIVECIFNDNSTHGIQLATSNKNCFVRNECNFNSSAGIICTNADKNLFDKCICSHCTNGIFLDVLSIENAVIECEFQTNSNIGVNNNNQLNSFFKNISQNNGSLNYQQVPLTTIGIFSLSAGTYVRGPSNIYNNISIVS